MGRPADILCKANVEELAENKWRCKHCKFEFAAGSATRIRNHLAGQGTDIRHCKAVPESVRANAVEALTKIASKKRGRISSSGEVSDSIRPRDRTVGETAFQVPSLNGDLSTHTNMGIEQEYSTTKLLLTSLISQNIPIDFVKAPHFRDFLKSAARHGIPPCLLREDSVGIERSLSSFEHDVNDRLLMIKDSWKITGCTMMNYYLPRKERRGDPSDLEVNDWVYGFYCPKGFIFVDGWQLDSSKGLEKAFKEHLLGLDTQDVTYAIAHTGCCSVCEFVDEEEYFYYSTDDVKFRFCARETVSDLWMEICLETNLGSELMRKSKKLSPTFEHCSWVEKDAAEQDILPFKVIKSIMKHKYKLEKDFLVPTQPSSNIVVGVGETITDNEYWSDGTKLVEALGPLMGIIDLKHNLVPTFSYLQVAVEEAKRTLKRRYEVSKYQDMMRFIDEFTLNSQGYAIYFNPFWDWRPLLLISVPDDELCELDTEIENAVTWCMEKEDQKEKIEAEMKIYRVNNPFANLPPFEPECNLPNPVTLWNKYGGEFPLLRKYAIQVLSLPSTCMCNHLKKAINRFKGEDNFVLRLNYHMLQEFTQLTGLIDKHVKRVRYHDPAIIQLSTDNDDLHIGQIPTWMNEFISKSTNVIGDGNCGYRAIAESLGWGQEKWRQVKQQLHDELENKRPIFEGTFVLSDVDTILEALQDYKEPGLAPRNTWLEVTDMGLLVASTFNAIFVVMGPTINHTFLPLYLPDGCQFSSVPEIAICLISERSHFISLSLKESAPLPQVFDMWTHHHQPSTEGFDRFLIDRRISYSQYSQLFPICSDDFKFWD